MQGKHFQYKKHTRRISLCTSREGAEGWGVLVKISRGRGRRYKREAHTHTVQKKSLMAIGQYNKRHEGKTKMTRRHRKNIMSKLLLAHKGTSVDCLVERGRQTKASEKAQSFRKRIQVELTTKGVPHAQEEERINKQMS